VSALTRDLSEIVASENLSKLGRNAAPWRKIAFHSPCTLQHGQQLTGVVEKILGELGFALTPVPEAHLCCGSAGTYSLLQRDLSQTLRARKLGNLESGAPECIATANIGCLAHLSGATELPVRHWIELLDGRNSA
jgi:glycolate oxidase iron-sulfur subunit